MKKERILVLDLLKKHLEKAGKSEPPVKRVVCSRAISP